MSQKIEDYGEKIGGAKKDLWKQRGLMVSDFKKMNDRESEKYVTKDNIWQNRIICSLCRMVLILKSPILEN